MVTDAVPTGDGIALQGYFRTWLTGSLAVDNSGGKTDGALYVTWEDGRFNARLDVESPFGLYRNANVLITRSFDGGTSWSSPVRVDNGALQQRNGFGIDHFEPAAAVDSTGALAACWYDRRDDPVNYRISRYCGVSTNLGSSWTNVRVDPRSWLPIHAADALVNPYYLGDYDTVATDRTKTFTGFQSAYGDVSLNAPVPNQDVFLVHIRE